MYILYSSNITEKGKVYEVEVQDPTQTFVILETPYWKTLQQSCNEKFVYVFFRENGTTSVSTGYVYNYSPNTEYDKLLYSGSYVKPESRASFLLNTEYCEELLYSDNFIIQSDGVEDVCRIVDAQIIYTKGIPSKMTLTCEIINSR